MAFGSLIVAVCSILRWALRTLDYYTHDLQQKNSLLMVVMKCVQCYMWCLEKTVQFITYYGYAIVATHYLLTLCAYFRLPAAYYPLCAPPPPYSLVPP